MPLSKPAIIAIVVSLLVLVIGGGVGIGLYFKSLYGEDGVDSSIADLPPTCAPLTASEKLGWLRSFQSIPRRRFVGENHETIETIPLFNRVVDAYHQARGTVGGPDLCEIDPEEFLKLSAAGKSHDDALNQLDQMFGGHSR